MDLPNQPFYILIKDTVTLVFTVAGLVLAGIGLNTWRKQLKGVKEFEIAYDLNTSALKVRDAIKFVRNPAILNNEIENSRVEYLKKYPHKSKDDAEKDANTFVYQLRWQKISDAYTEVESHLLGAEVLWGKEVLQELKSLKGCVVSLNIALFKYFNAANPKDRQESFDVVYNSGNDDSPDEFSKIVDGAVDELHNFLKDKL